MSAKYNGHKDKGHWNIALWISNDEPLYRFAMECIEGAKAAHSASSKWPKIATYRFVQAYGDTRTPDGFKYTEARVKAALKDLGEE